MKPLTVDEHRFESFDGTELACHSVGDGPPVLLANGLGGSWRAWSRQIEYFRDRHRFVSWDYRGLYRSEAPRDRDPLEIADHAEDAIAVLDALEIERAAVLGWSMGVQAMEAMVGSLQDAELLVVPGGTHYVAVEYPELVNLRVEKFFRERGYV